MKSEDVSAWMSDGRAGLLIDPADPDAFLDRLRWRRGEFIFVPVRGWPSEWLPGLVHSALGARLRELGCQEPGGCAGYCLHPAACIYGRLFEPQPSPDSRSPAWHGNQRIPVPLAIGAVRSSKDALTVHLALLGHAGDDAFLVGDALERALALGLGRSRHPFEPVSGWWRGERLGDEFSPACSRIDLELVTPLRLIENKRDLTSFSIEVLVRDLMLRVAAWGHFYQGLPWPPPWEQVRADARAARVLAAETSRVSVSRYSARQQQRIAIAGLTGRVQLDDVTPLLLRLLCAGAAMHAGKGASVGLGRYHVARPDEASGES